MFRPKFEIKRILKRKKKKFYKKVFYMSNISIRQKNIIFEKNSNEKTQMNGFRASVAYFLYAIIKLNFHFDKLSLFIFIQRQQKSHYVIRKASFCLYIHALRFLRFLTYYYGLSLSLLCYI